MFMVHLPERRRHRQTNETPVKAPIWFISGFVALTHVLTNVVDELVIFMLAFGLATIVLSFITITYSSTVSRRMFAAFGQFASTSQFYLYGRTRCTKTGWEKASKAYPKPDVLETADLADKVFMVTGANGGIGKEITRILASKQATVYMVCRSAERGAAAKNDISSETKNDKLHLLLGDCGLEKDVRRVWTEFVEHRQQVAPSGPVKLDALVCNAGALLNELTLTEEDVEVTFAAHLLFGTYLLGSLAMPTLQATPSSRLIAVSSGGMYNSKFPKWEDATSTGTAKYDGQFAYVYAKRGQVLLCEEWAKQYGDSVKIVSCHPGNFSRRTIILLNRQCRLQYMHPLVFICTGWVGTEGVDKAYGESKKYLEPLRSLWEGSEGIAWLCAAPAEQIENGAFYLDRSPQVKHMAGPFFTEGSFTKNTPEEVAEMMAKLQQWSAGDRPSFQEAMTLAAQRKPLVATAVPIDLASFMGEWYVLANIPTSVEVGATNCIERYSLDDTRANTVKVHFTYSFPAKDGTFTSSQIKMRGDVKNAPTSTFWTVHPKVLGMPLPIGLSYLIVDVAEDYSYTMVSVPDRSYLWIMIRNVPSEFTTAGVSILDAYPEIQSARDGAVEASVDADLPVPGSTGVKADTTATSVPPTAPAHAHHTSVPSTDAHTAEMAAVTQVKWRDFEVGVLQRACAKAEELGFDTGNILRCPWNNQVGKQA